MAWKNSTIPAGADSRNWLRKEFERSLSDEERAQSSPWVAWTLIEDFKKRLEEQQERTRRRQQMDRH